jgi:hypothetical protein
MRFRIDFRVCAGPNRARWPEVAPMHLPVGPDRRPGAEERARLDQFRLRRGLAPEDGPAYAAARLAALRRLAGHQDTGPAWRPLGPFAIPHGRTAGSGPGSRPRVAGRVVAVAVDPGDPGHLLAGGGGLWESRDGGRGWEPRADDQPTAAVGAVAFAPGDPSVAYAGTGQGEALAALGVGVLASGDGGATWRGPAGTELLGVGVHALLVDPGDAGRLLAATTAGLWASADGGLGWEPRLAGRCWAVSAGADGELLAGGEHGLHRSTDGGASWRPVPLASAPAGFDRVAVARGAGGRVTWVFAAGDGVGHLWRRDQSGAFEPIKPPADLHSRQAWHSWACAGDPGDPDVVWLGAGGLHRGARGADGRWAWVDLAARPAGDSLPPGQHAVVPDPADRRALYVANEGGLYRSPDGGRTWRSLNTGLAVAEVDRLADHAAWLLAGAGELGTLRYEGGEVWCPVGAGQPAVAAGDELVAPGVGGLAVSGDGGSTWAAVGLPGIRGSVTALAAAGPGRLLAGTDEGELARLERAGGAWVVAGTARPRPGRVAGVATDPGRPEVAWAAWSGPGGGGVWRSEDGGATWADRSGGLPEVPVGAVAPDPDRPGTVVVATDAGVWRSDDGGSGWRPLGRGLPNAPVLALALRRPERLLRAGLLGRGVWELPLEAGGEPAAARPALRSGRSPAARPRPGGPWWECPDLKLEVPPAPREGPVSPVEFEDDRWPDAAGLPELGGRVTPGRPARVHVQVHHRGDGPLPSVQVRVLAAPACLRPPDLPPGDWLLHGDPPPGSSWHPVGPLTPLGPLHPGRSAVATIDWQVPPDLPRDLCLLAVATAPDLGTPAPDLGTPLPGPAGTPTPDPAAIPNPDLGPDLGGTPIPDPSSTPNPDPSSTPNLGPAGTATPGIRGPNREGSPTPELRDPAVHSPWPGSGDPAVHSPWPGSGDPLAHSPEVGHRPPGGVAADPADLVAGDGRWGCKNLTVLEAGRGRVLRLELVGAAGRGPFGVAAEGWVAGLTGGLVLPRWLGGLARESGLVAGRVAEPWRPELVSLVREEPALAERLDLGAVFAVPAADQGGGLELWLEGIELDPERSDPFLLLLREPPASGRGCLLLLDADGGVLGGHTLQVAR